MNGPARLLVLVIGVSILAGCGGPSYQGRERRDDGPHGWVKLTSRTVDFRGDHDVLEVGGDRRFTAIRFTVDEGDMVMDHIRVIFRNGEMFEPDMRAEFREGASSREIDLPGNARFIRRIEFFYRAVGRHGPAVINLYGRMK